MLTRVLITVESGEFDDPRTHRHTPTPRGAGQGVRGARKRNRPVSPLYNFFGLVLPGEFC